MPKRKSPYKVEKTENNALFYVDVGGTNYWASEDVGKVRDVRDLLNEAYAHGRRNGMRAGRKG